WHPEDQRTGGSRPDQAVPNAVDQDRWLVRQLEQELRDPLNERLMNPDPREHHVVDRRRTRDRHLLEARIDRSKKSGRSAAVAGAPEHLPAAPERQLTIRAEQRREGLRRLEQRMLPVDGRPFSPAEDAGRPGSLELIGVEAIKCLVQGG